MLETRASPLMIPFEGFLAVWIWNCQKSSATLINFGFLMANRFSQQTEISGFNGQRAELGHTRGQDWMLR